MVDRDTLPGWLDHHGVRMVRLEGTLLDGVMAGKHLAVDKFTHALDGICLADFIFALDLGGGPQLGWWADWRSEALGDLLLRPDLSTMQAPTADVPGVATCLGDFTTVSGAPIPVCPRTLLRTQVDRLAALGFDARAAFELEFFIVEERIDAARRRRFKGLTPLGTTNGKGAYLTQRSPEFLPFFTDVAERLEAQGIPWEAFNDEAAPGQFELNLAAADPVTTCDRVMRTKRALRDAAFTHGRSVTFMARPFAELSYGSGLHLHLSLLRAGEAVFGANSPELRHWVAGYLATIAGATSILTPTINSFRRQVDFAAVPTTPTWGEDNKGAAVRTITRAGTAARVEHRVAAADANPYLVLATLIAGGTAGLREQLEPPEAVHDLPWGLPDSYDRLPGSITTAAEALSADNRLRAALGDVFVDHWVASRKWEWLMFHTEGGDPDATGATDWELHRYFEWV